MTGQATKPAHPIAPDLQQRIGRRLPFARSLALRLDPLLLPELRLGLTRAAWIQHQPSHDPAHNITRHCRLSSARTENAACASSTLARTTDGPGDTRPECPQHDASVRIPRFHSAQIASEIQASMQTLSPAISGKNSPRSPTHSGAPSTVRSGRLYERQLQESLTSGHPGL